MDEEALKRARVIVKAQLEEKDLKPDTASKISAWLVSGAHEEEKWQAIEELWGKYVVESHETSSKLDVDFEEIAKLLGFPEEIYKLSDVVVPHIKIKRVRVHQRIAYRVAAVLLPFVAMAGAAYFMLDRSKVSTSEAHYAATEITVVNSGSAQSIILPDGSEVVLRGQSKIAYEPEFANGRSVELTGEAVFNVVRLDNADGERLPFTVLTDNIAVHVTGTTFCVSELENYGSGYVSLYSGSVNVEVNDMFAELEHGEKLVYDISADESEVLLISADEMLENGYMPLLRFDNSSLGNLITALEVNYNVTFVVPEGTDLSAGRYSANFESISLESVLELLSLSDDTYSFKRSGDKVIVSKK